MLYLLLLVLLFWLFVVVCSGAVVIRRAHVDVPAMFARAATICGHTTGPAFTIAGGGSVSVLQGLVFDVGIGVGGKAPDSGDLLGHWDGMLMWENARAMFGREQSLYP